MTSLPQPIRKSPGERERLRSAFTLFEMLVVLAVVGVIAGLSWPRLGRYLQENEVRSNAERVRQTVDQCRVKAVDEGLIYQFRYEPFGRRFLIMPYELAEETASQQTTTTSRKETKSLGHVYQTAKTIAFQPPQGEHGKPAATERLPEEFLLLIDNGIENRDVAWSLPVLFYPDGSSTDHYLSVEDLAHRSITLSIRSLTGTITTSQLEYVSGGSHAR